MTDKDILLAIIDLRSEMKTLMKRVEKLESNAANDSKEDEGLLIEELERQKSDRRKTSVNIDILTGNIDILQEKLDVIRGFNE